MERQRSQRNTGGQVIMESKEQMAIRKDERSVLRDPQNHHRISQDASHWWNYFHFRRWNYYLFFQVLVNIVNSWYTWPTGILKNSRLQL